jgi:hypothetical protein
MAQLWDRRCSICSTSNYKTILFAYITNLLISSTDLNSLADNANMELCKIATYLVANKLSLNTEKTVYMFFCHPNLNLKIGDQKISEVKFLGVTIDNQLNFKTHFQKCHQKS